MAAQALRSALIRWLIYIAVLGFVFSGTDNYAHLGGFLGGYAVSALLNPLTRERGDHLLIAIGCLVATLLAIVASVVAGRGMFL